MTEETVPALPRNWVYHMTHSNHVDSILASGLRSSEYDLNRYRNYGIEDEDDDAEPDRAHVVFFSTDRDWLIEQYGDQWDTLLAFDVTVAVKSLSASIMDDTSIDNEGRAEILYRDEPFVIPPAIIRVVANYDEDTGRWPV